MVTQWGVEIDASSREGTRLKGAFERSKHRGQGGSALWVKMGVRDCKAQCGP